MRGGGSLLSEGGGLVVGHDPLLIHSGVVAQLLRGEPVGDLGLGRLGSVGSVDDVASNLHAQVATDGSGGGVKGVGGAHKEASALDAVGALPHHGHDGAGGEELHQAAEEGLVGQVGIVRSGLLLSGVHQLHANQLPALGLETLDDLAHLLALHSVGLAGDEGALLGGAGHTGVGGASGRLGLACHWSRSPRSCSSSSDGSGSNSSSSVNRRQNEVVNQRTASQGGYRTSAAVAEFDRAARIKQNCRLSDHYGHSEPRKSPQVCNYVILNADK